MTSNQPNGLSRLRSADYSMTYNELWGGTKIGTDAHSLRRSFQRYCSFSSIDLVVWNAALVSLKGGEPLEDAVMSLPFESQFVIYDEAQDCAYFLEIGYNAETQLNEMFIHSLFVRQDPHRPIYCHATDKGLYKVCRDGSFVENPKELAISQSRN